MGKGIAHFWKDMVEFFGVEPTDKQYELWKESVKFESEEIIAKTIFQIETGRLKHFPTVQEFIIVLQEVSAKEREKRLQKEQKIQKKDLEKIREGGKQEWQKKATEYMLGYLSGDFTREEYIKKCEDIKFDMSELMQFHKIRGNDLNKFPRATQRNTKR